MDLPVSDATPGSRALLVALSLAALAGAPLAGQSPRTIAVGRSVTDSLTSHDPVGRSRHSPYHVWTLQGRRGQKIVVDLVSSDFDAYLVLRDADGFVVGSDDDSGGENNARLHAILPREGAYRIVATAFGDSGRGRYTLTVSGWETPDVPAPGAVSPIRVGETKQGVLEPGDELSGDGPFQDRWTFEASAGARLRVELRSTDFDAYLVVLGPDGQVVGSDDDGLGGHDALVSVRASAAGRYTILATSYGEDPRTGSYRLSLVEETGSFADPGTASAIAVGETKEGRLEEGDARGARGLEDRWSFEGRAGQTVRIDVMSSAFDSYAVLRFGETPLDSNDDGGDGNNARIMHVLPNNGAYTVVVSGYSGGRSGGAYTIGIIASTAPPAAGQTGRVSLGQRSSGRLEPGDHRREEGGYQDEWELDGHAGQDVQIELRSGDFDTFLELLDPHGAKVAENDDGLGSGTDSFIAARLDQTGRYRIIARSYGDREATGLYELHVSSGGPVGRAGAVLEIHAGETLNGRLEAGDSIAGDSTYTDVLLFRPTRAGEVVIDLRSADFDAYLILQDSEGVTLATDDDGGSGTDARITTTVRSGRTYRILANSYGRDRATGSYRLSVRWSTQ